MGLSAPSGGAGTDITCNTQASMASIRGQGRQGCHGVSGGSGRLSVPPHPLNRARQRPLRSAQRTLITASLPTPLGPLMTTTKPSCGATVGLSSKGPPNASSSRETRLLACQQWRTAGGSKGVTSIQAVGTGRCTQCWSKQTRERALRVLVASHHTGKESQRSYAFVMEICLLLAQSHSCLRTKGTSCSSVVARAGCPDAADALGDCAAAASKLSKRFGASPADCSWVEPELSPRQLRFSCHTAAPAVDG